MKTQGSTTDLILSWLDSQLTVQEISTMLRQGLKPIIVVLNNDGYVIERLIHGPERKYVRRQIHFLHPSWPFTQSKLLHHSLNRTISLIGNGKNCSPSSMPTTFPVAPISLQPELNLRTSWPKKLSGRQIVVSCSKSRWVVWTVRESWWSRRS